MELAIILGVLTISVGLFALWLWTLVDAIRTPDEAFRAGSQLVWVLVIVFAQLIGSIVYLAVGRPRRGA